MLGVTSVEMECRDWRKAKLKFLNETLEDKP